MKIKEKFLNSVIFVKELNRLVKVEDKSIEKLKRFKHLFEDDSTKKTKSKRVRDNSKGNDEAGNSELSV